MRRGPRIALAMAAPKNLGFVTPPEAAGIAGAGLDALAMGGRER